MAFDFIVIAVFLVSYFILLYKFLNFLFKWNLNRELKEMEKSHG
jgi:hypothetical protein